MVQPSYPNRIGLLLAAGMVAAMLPPWPLARADFPACVGSRLDVALEPGGTRNQGGPFVPAVPVPRIVPPTDAVIRVMQVLPLRMPLTNYRMASGFGRRSDPINRRTAMHEGIDLAAPLRTPVVATGSGKVVFAGMRGRYGKLVEIDHGLGVRTRYAHLGVIRVAVGQRVAAGQRVGLVGRTGRTTGPHLHYEVLVDGKPDNPLRFIRSGGRSGGAALK